MRTEHLKRARSPTPENASPVPKKTTLDKAHSDCESFMDDDSDFEMFSDAESGDGDTEALADEDSDDEGFDIQRLSVDEQGDECHDLFTSLDHSVNNGSLKLGCFILNAAIGALPGSKGEMEEAVVNALVAFAYNRDSYSDRLQRAQVADMEREVHGD